MAFFNRNKKVPNDPEPGAYKIVPSYTFDYSSDADCRNKIPVYIIEYYLKYQNHKGGEWKEWEIRSGRPHTFNTEEEAKTAYEEHLKREYKILMHLESGSGKVYNRYQFIQDKAAELGIETRITPGKIFQNTYLVFKNEEDINLFKLSTDLKETSQLLFLSESEL